MYSHRNGETEPPTIDDWYWFDGSFYNTFGNVAFVTKDTEVVQMEEGLVWANGNNSGFEPSQCKGRWWGPIERPKR